MAEFLKAINQLCFHFSNKYEHLKEKAKLNSFVIMNKDKIDDESIKFNSDNLEGWTNACKYMLQNLKWLIYMSQIEDRIRQETAKSS